MYRACSCLVRYSYYNNGHKELGGISNHQPHDCLLKRLFRRRSKKTSKLRVTGLCEGNSPVIGEFPAQRASNAENVFIWWRHHDMWWLARYSIWTRAKMPATPVDNQQTETSVPPSKSYTPSCLHYGDVKMGMIASQITSLAIVNSTVYAGADRRKHQSSASLAFVWVIHR